jgi:hypothetical protein
MCFSVEFVEPTPISWEAPVLGLVRPDAQLNAGN